VSAATKVFTGLTLLVAVVVVVVVTYVVYVRPPDHPVDTATIEVSGTPGTLFEGTVRTNFPTRSVKIEGKTPRTFNIDTGATQFMIVTVGKTPAQRVEGTGALKVSIRVGARTVAERQAQAEDQYVSVVGNVPDALKP
jgi:hypothetical protein